MTTFAQFHNLIATFGDVDEQAKLEHDNLVQNMPVSPLALILYWRDGGSDGEFLFTDNIKFLNKNMYTSLEYFAGSVKRYPEVNQCYIDQAEVICKYFRNKLLIAGLKGNELSEFRVELMDYLENPRKLKNKHIKILLRLPDFYQEDVIMHDLMTKYTSADEIGTDLDTEIEFVATINRPNARNPKTRHYFKTSDNKLLCFEIDNSDKLVPVLNYFVNTRQQVRFKGNVYSLTKPGYPNFNFYSIGSNKYEFY